MTASEHVIHELNDAYRAWDLDRLRAVLDEDVVYHIPGRSRWGGDFVGRDAVLALWEEQRRFMGEQPFRVQFADVLESDQYLVAITAGEADAEGRHVGTRGANIYRIRDGRILECWPLYADIYAFDEFWGKADDA
jgi:uncharacterized protein